MNGEGLPLGSLSPAEATSAAARVQQLQELVAKAATATTPAGESSFAAALQAASAEGGAPPEAPEPPPAPETGPGETGGTFATTTYAPNGGAAAGTSATAAYEPSAATTYASMADYSPGSYSVPPTYYPTTSSPYSTSPYQTPSAYPTSSSPYPTSSSPYPPSSYSSSPYSTSDALSASSYPSGASVYAGMVERAALQNGVEPALLMGLIEQESGFDPNAQSGAGASGLTQLMPSTAASLGVTEPLDPEQSIAGGARLLGQLLRQFDGNVSDALAAYNAGAGAVERYGGIPPYPETESYVAKVLANAQSYRGAS